MDKFCKDRYNFAMDNLKKMLDNKIYTDCILECVGGTIRAHRCVLMAANSFFYKAFTNNEIEDTLIHMEFDKVSIEVMHILVDSMYGQLPPDLLSNRPLLVKVMELCHFVEEKFLLTYLLTSLTDQITVDNCIEMWSIATDFGHKETEERVLSYIMDNLNLILQEDKLIKVSPSQLHELLTYAMNNSNCTDHLLQAIIKWGKSSPKLRLQPSIELIDRMDKSKITTSYVKKLVSSDWFVKSSPDLCKIIGDVHSKFCKLVAENYKQNIQIQFYCTGEKGKTDQIYSQRYGLRDKEWFHAKTVNLPPSSTSWYPMISVGGDQFYFGISSDKKFVAYCEFNRELYTGPTVTYEARVTGVVDGHLMYVWNYECIVQFNSKNKSWKSLTPIHNVLSPSNLLAINGRLYFHAVFPPTISMYNFNKDEWELKRTLRETANIKSIKCKCYRENCKGKLYFVANDKQLMSYDTVAEVWAVKVLPELQCSMPIFMNCDESFIVFSNKHRFNHFFLYYPISNKWESFENENFSYDNVNLVTCDLYVKS